MVMVSPPESENGNFQAFARIRAETAAWCNVEGKHSALRSPALRPQIPQWPTSEDLAAAVEGIQVKRRELCGDRVFDQTPAGRLLVSWFNESISSGESKLVTSGFFDLEDWPPWDTWLCHLRSVGESVTLLSWVPAELQDLVAKGINSNPYGCILWLSDAPFRRSPFVAQLLAAGFDQQR